MARVGLDLCEIKKDLAATSMLRGCMLLSDRASRVGRICSGLAQNDFDKSWKVVNKDSAATGTLMVRMGGVLSGFMLLSGRLSSVRTV